MLKHVYVTQPGGTPGHLDALETWLLSPQVTEFCGAVAYATSSGVEAMTNAFTRTTALEKKWAAVNKRWVVGVDWLRTDPQALERLATLPNSTVKVHDGAFIVARPGCHPRLPWHPKVFLASGPDYRAVLHGSGNLSRNGLTAGHEVGAVLAVESAKSADEKALKADLDALDTWFNNCHRVATGWSRIDSAYRARYAADAHKHLVPTDDDSSASTRVGTGARSLTTERVKALRICDNFWIQTGNLTKNRGPSRPGDQLMMSPMTRVFFGVPANDVPTNTTVGLVTIRMGAAERTGCSLRFSDNSMDVLTLPVPGSPWPAAYDNEVLLFTRVLHGGRRKYSMKVGTKAEVRAWQGKSAAQGSDWKMTSGRRFGAFS